MFAPIHEGASQPDRDSESRGVMELSTVKSTNTDEIKSEWWENWRNQVRLLRSVFVTSAPQCKLDSDLRVIISNAFEQYASSVATPTPKDAIPVLSGGRDFFETAFTWLGGWRPTSAVLLVFSITNIENKKEPGAFPELNGHAAVLSEGQLYRITSLQAHMQQAEDDLSDRLALLQMLVPDQNLISAVTAQNWSKTRAAVEDKITDLRDLVGKADSLRLQTLHELQSVLCPTQAAKCIVVAFELGYTIKTLKGSLQKHTSFVASALKRDSTSRENELSGQFLRGTRDVWPRDSQCLRTTHKAFNYAIWKALICKM